jgi:hypothetical protein
VRFSVSAAEEHEPSTPKVSRLRMNHCERESCGHRSIDRVSTSAHHLDSSLGC